jgi:hypothetical protein
MTMGNMFSRILLAGSLVLPVTQFAIGQQPRQAGQPPQPGVRQGNDLSGSSAANRPTNGQDRSNQILRGSQIIGSTVNLRGGSRLGPVQDFVVSDSGCVDYVIATYQGQYVPIPWAAALYQSGPRVLLVDIDAARIHEMPMFRQISELTNRQSSDKVSTFYRGVHGQAGDRNQPGAAGQQGAQNNAQPAKDAAANKPAVGATQGTQGSRNTASRRTGDHR